MKKIAIVLLAVSGMTFAGATEGKAIYSTKCASCHGADGVAKEAMAKMMKVDMKSLGSKEVQAKSDADLKKIILNGQGKMKAQTVPDKQADDVVAFLRTLK
jgi:mono/diheme cytochrome c family protein